MGKFRQVLTILSARHTVVACVIVSLFYFEWIASVICTEFEKKMFILG